MKVEVSDDIARELKYMLQLHADHGAANQQVTLEGMINYILSAVADGSRRPGSWERSMLDSMGLIADTELHHVHRSDYGPPGR